MSTIAKLEKAQQAAEERHAAALAEAEQAQTELERLTGEIADKPITTWVELAGTYMQALGLQRLAAAAAGVLARRKHRALVAIYQARVDELSKPAAEAFERARQARAKAQELDKRMLRFVNGGDADAKALQGEERDEYEINLRTEREQARARASVLDRARNAASAKRRAAEEALADVEATGPE